LAGIQGLSLLIGTNKTALFANTITFIQTNARSGTSGAAGSSKTKLGGGGGGKGKERASPVGLSRNVKTGTVPSSLREALRTTNVRWSGSFQTSGEIIPLSRQTTRYQTPAGKLLVAVRELRAAKDGIFSSELD
jgi:hypothetical protein